MLFAAFLRRLAMQVMVMLFLSDYTFAAGARYLLAIVRECGQHLPRRLHARFDGELQSCTRWYRRLG
jgi:hypothetical protein